MDRRRSSRTLSVGQEASPNQTTGARRTSFTHKRRSSFNSKQPAKDLLINVPVPHKAVDSEDEDGLEVMPDGEIKASDVKLIKGKRRDVYQCEICSKWYRHSACLIKHRWQHTDYWAEVSRLNMSKHQTVALLETAAILTNGSSLPEEKSLWPAAVSPPQSGLLGSSTLNAEVLKSARYGSFSSSLKSSLPTIPSKLMSRDGSTDSEADNDEEDIESDEIDQVREEDMFAMEEDELLEPSTGATSAMSIDEGYGGDYFVKPSSYLKPSQTHQMPPPLFGRAYHGRTGITAPRSTSVANHSISAPTLGFFAPKTSYNGSIIIDKSSTTDMDLN